MLVAREGPDEETEGWREEPRSSEVAIAVILEGKLPPALHPALCAPASKFDLNVADEKTDPALLRNLRGRDVLDLMRPLRAIMRVRARCSTRKP